MVIAAALLPAALMLAAAAAPTLRFADVARRQVALPSRIVWLNDDQLLAEMAGPAGEPRPAELIELADGTSRNLAPAVFVSPSPDGAHFLARDGAAWRLASANADVSRFPDPPSAAARSAVAPPAWARDGRRFAVAYADYPGPPPAYAGTVAGSPRIRDVGAEIDGATPPATAICIFDVAAPMLPPHCLERPAFVQSLAFSASGALYFSEQKFFGFDAAGPATRLSLWRPAAPDVDEVARLDGVMQMLAPSPAPHTEEVVIAADVDSRVFDDYVSLLSVDPDGKQRRLTRDLRIAAPPFLWSADGRTVLFTARRGGFDDIWRVQPGQAPSLVATGPRRHFDLQRSPSGAMLSYQTLDGEGRRDLRIRPVAGGSERILKVFDTPSRDHRLGAVTQIAWPNGEGDNIAGFLILPPDFDAARRYPLLVDVHGGGPGSPLPLAAPLTLGLAPGPLEWHAWAALGFVVFVPDFRSSGSYGAKAVAARYAQKDFTGIKADARDIDAGIRALLRKGYIDPARIVLFGHSAGGARVSYLLTQRRYAAAVLHEATGGPLAALIQGVSGPLTGHSFEDTLAPAHGARLAAAPRQYQDGFLFDGYKARTPTLLLIGGAPGATPALPSEALFSVLRQYRIPTRLLRFEDEGHVFQSAAGAEAAFDIIRIWFDEALSTPDAKTPASPR